MKKILVMLVIGIFMFSFISADLISTHATNENGQNGNQEGVLTQSQVKEVIQERNRLRINQSGECPNDCTCTGSTTKCQFNGSREMTIQAGNSGNTIVQVKGIQAQTQVQLYKDGEKIYGQFKNNQTKQINFMPDEIKEMIQQRLRQQNCSCENMTLDEEGNYQIQTQKQARLFGLFKVREKVRLEYDSGTGEFPVPGEEIISASPGTVGDPRAVRSPFIGIRSLIIFEISSTFLFCALIKFSKE